MQAFPAPTSLQITVAEVCVRHPFDEDGDLDLSSPVGMEQARKLWERLLSLRDKQQRETVQKLGKSEIRTLVETAEPRLVEARALDLLGTIATEHPLSTPTSLCWTALLSTDGRAEFRSGALQHAQKHKYVRPSWEDIARANAPSEWCAREFLRHSDTDLGSWLNHEIALHAPGFRDAVCRCLIGPACILELDRRVAGDKILELMHLLVPEQDRTTWRITFLACTHAGHKGNEHAWRLKHPVVAEIVREYGAPRSNGEFWQQVSPEVRIAVERWLTDQQLTDLLGDNDRTEFWRRFLDQIREVQSSIDRSVIFIEFSGWTAVQFRNAGTATYMYRSQRVRGLRRRDEHEIARYVRNHSAEALGWYEHRGHTSTWQSGAWLEVINVQWRMRNG